ncbi:MAG TPA: hypothetical protein VNZ86_10840, partial [Bacteroidia bacterium]|nr:hypothetical protein [Bacteroidia bacterium]
LLIPGLNPEAPAPIAFAGITVTFVALATFTGNPDDYPQLEFGITGGYDTEATNLATATKTNFFLKLQPFQWAKQNAIQRFSQAADTYIILEAQVALGSASYRTGQGYYLPAPQINYDQFTAAAPTKVAPYRAILAATTGAEATANLLPVYGIGDVPGEDTQGRIETNPNVRVEWVLYNLIASIARVQDREANPERLRGAVIIPMLANITDGVYTRLTAMLATAPEPAPVPAIPNINTYSGANTLSTRTQIVMFNVEGLAGIIEALTATSILIVKFNGLPVGAFNYLYSQSTLPCIFEGKGTANLVLNLNIPYLNLVKSEIRAGDTAIARLSRIYPTLPLNALPSDIVRATQAQAFQLITSASVLNTALAPEQDIAASAIGKIQAFIQAAYTADSPTATYFTNLSTFYHDERNDKLILGLNYFLQYVNGLDA